MQGRSPRGGGHCNFLICLDLLGEKVARRNPKATALPCILHFMIWDTKQNTNLRIIQCGRRSLSRQHCRRRIRDNFRWWQGYWRQLQNCHCYCLFLVCSCFNCRFIYILLRLNCSYSRLSYNFDTNYLSLNLIKHASRVNCFKYD